jgi:RHS repeat-associated protein
MLSKKRTDSKDGVDGRFVQDWEGLKTNRSHPQNRSDWRCLRRWWAAGTEGHGTPSRCWHDSYAKSQILYLGGFEVYTEYSSDGDTVTLKRERLSVSDGTSRVAIVETLTSGADSLEASSPLIRYQISNSLGSVSIELDDVGSYLVRRIYALWLNLIPSRTEQLTTAKKYRYTGKDRDRESGFYYHGARYYMPWLGRWVSADPAGFVDGPNLFIYANNNPVFRNDPDGTNGRVTVGVPGNPQTEEQLKEIMVKKGVTWTGHAKQTRPSHWEVIGGVITVNKKPGPSGSETSGASEPPGGAPGGAPGGSPTGSPQGTPEGSPAGSDTGTATGAQGGQGGHAEEAGPGGSAQAAAQQVRRSAASGLVGASHWLSALSHLRLARSSSCPTRLAGSRWLLVFC